MLPRHVSSILTKSFTRKSRKTYFLDPSVFISDPKDFIIFYLFYLLVTTMLRIRVHSHLPSIFIDVVLKKWAHVRTHGMDTRLYAQTMEAGANSPLCYISYKLIKLHDGEIIPELL